MIIKYFHQSDEEQLGRIVTWLDEDYAPQFISVRRGGWFPWPSPGGTSPVTILPGDEGEPSSQIFVPPEPVMFMVAPWAWTGGGADDPVSAATIDEDYTDRSLPPFVLLTSQTFATISQWVWNQDEVTQFSSPTEDYWPNPVPLPRATFTTPSAWLYDQSDIAAAGIPDEDFWRNPSFPAVWTFRGLNPWSFEQNDFWQPPEPDEDFWTNPVLPAPFGFRWTQPWPGEQQEMGNFPRISVDEEQYVPLPRLAEYISPRSWIRNWDIDDYRVPAPSTICITVTLAGVSVSNVAIVGVSATVTPGLVSPCGSDT